MDLLQRFLDQFTPSGEAEALWLKDIFTFITEHLQPELSGPAPPPAADDVITGVCSDQLSVCVVKKIKENMSVTHTLPVSYRPVSVSELLSRQHLSCVSNLSWSTNQQRAWAKEAELSLPGLRALPRVNLLLIGCLREGRGGEWRLTDASGSVRCELHHVHFLYRPCPDLPPSMLCTCLRSSLRVTAFSRVGGSPPDSSCPSDGVLPRLLLEKNTDVSGYLWTCYLSSQLTHSLVPSVMKQQCVCVLSWKLMECVRKGGGGGGGRRDIYSEMLDEPHTCPLTQYHTDPAVHQYISVSELSQSLQSDCWSSLSLSSLLPSGGSSLTRSQINTALAWSCRTLTSDPQNNPQSGDRLRHRPLLLVGVLELPSQTSEPALQLRRDGSCGLCRHGNQRGRGGRSEGGLQHRLDRSELVCFQALVSDRISLNDRTRDSGDTHTGVRLTVCDQTGRSLQVYLDLSHTPYPPGLLPGNTLLLSAFQIRLSRTGSVYCSYLPVSSITVVSLGDTSAVRPPPPIMHLGVWATSTEQRCILGQVKGHVVCFLFLLLQWICSLCGSLYVQCCSSSQCRSTSSVFQSKAKLVIDDGTGEAHVWFSGAVVRPLLGLADSQWEGLQRALRVRGHIKVYPRGRSLVCDSDDSLLHFLLCVCSSDVVCRQLSLTCRKHNNQRSEEKKRFSRGERDFMTRMTRPLQLTCLHINTH